MEWMIVLFMVVSFAIGCVVDRMCQLFLSECVFSVIVFGLLIMDF